MAWVVWLPPECAGVGEVLGGIAPDDVADFPGHSENLSAGAMNIDDRFCAQVADAGLECDAALRRDDDQTVEADGAADIAAERYADAAHLGADAFGLTRHSFLPLELLGAAVERFLEEAAGRVTALAVDWRGRTPPCLQGS